MPSKIVHEDENCVAFLDVMPRSKGMCIVAPKKHYQFFDEDFNLSSKTFDTALIVAEKIKKSLEPLTVFFSVLQAQVPHFHIRVYPVYKDQIPLGENQPIEANDAQMGNLASKIKSASAGWQPKKEVVEVVKEVPVERKEPKPKPEPEERSEKESDEEEPKEEKSDDYWRRRNWEVA